MENTQELIDVTIMSSGKKLKMTNEQLSDYVWKHWTESILWWPPLF